MPSSTGKPPMSSLTHCGAHITSATSRRGRSGTERVADVRRQLPGVGVVQPPLALNVTAQTMTHGPTLPGQGRRSAAVIASTAISA